MTAEEYAKTHQRACRVAFDFLNAHFPPVDEDEWWDKAAKDASTASLSANEEALAIELINAVMNYLGEEQKRRNEHDGTDHRTDAVHGSP